MSSKKKFYETTGFSALRDEWYQRLKETGFNDIEAGNTDETIVKTEIITPPVVQDKIQMVLQIVNTKKSELRPMDLQILELYSESKTVTEIAKAVGISHQAVSKRLRLLISKYF